MQDRLLLSAGGEEKLYVEDVFSTYLYTGNGSTQTITNGIDLAGKGGLVWTKARNTGYKNALFDTSRGVRNALYTNTTETTNGGYAPAPSGYDLDTFGSTGFGLGIDYNSNVNTSGVTLASWTFREAPKFFDVVTYTGTGYGTTQTISHNLGVAPGFIVVKCTSGSGTNYPWVVWSRGANGGNAWGFLNGSSSFTTGAAQYMWGDDSSYVAPTSTGFTVASDPSNNGNGQTYVAYLFAHDPTADGVIQCGSATCSGGIATANLGWEPQWVLAKQTNTTGDWRLIDNMRGWTNNSGGNQQGLRANTSAAESSSGWGDTLSPTGFNLYGGSTDTFVYIAIRRGPMKTPTSGTSVFSPQSASLSFSGNTVVSSGTAGPMDAVISQMLSGAAGIPQSRLTGDGVLYTPYTYAEQTSGGYTNWDRMTGTKPVPRSGSGSNPHAVWQFKRAPGFFDVVCYTGTGVAGATFNHNLGVAPELMIVKVRDSEDQWAVYSAPTGNTKYAVLNAAAPFSTNAAWWNNTSPTASVFATGNAFYVNGSGYKYIAYLFASCPGVSKVGSYTGNGSSQTINCGFAAGARFVMIKRTDSTGDWYVWDTARGMVALNDPHLSLNTTAAEVTTDDSVDTDNTGFIVNQVSATNVNVNGATYIYLAIA